MFGSIKIFDGLFIGDEIAAGDLEFISTNKIKKVINCSSQQIPNHWSSIGIEYLSFDWREEYSQIHVDESTCNEIYRFIETGLSQSNSIMVHGIHNQSTSYLAISIYLMLKFSWSLGQTYDYMVIKQPNFFLTPHFESIAELVEKFVSLRTQHESQNSITAQKDSAIAKGKINKQEEEKNDKVVIWNTFINTKVGFDQNQAPQVDTAGSTRMPSGRNKLPKIAEEENKESVKDSSDNRQQYQGMEYSQGKSSSGVRWPDEDGSTNPISRTIPGSELEPSCSDGVIDKITAHKRFPSYKVKPIIKQTNMTWIPEKEGYQKNYLSFYSKNIQDSFVSPTSQCKMAQTEDHSRRIFTNDFDQYNDEVHDAICENISGNNLHKFVQDPQDLIKGAVAASEEVGAAQQAPLVGYSNSNANFRAKNTQDEYNNSMKQLPPDRVEKITLPLKDFLTTSSSLLGRTKNRFRSSQEWMNKARPFKRKDLNFYPSSRLNPEKGPKSRRIYSKPQSAKRGNAYQQPLVPYQRNLLSRGMGRKTSRNMPKNMVHLSNNPPTKNKKALFSQSLKETNSFFVIGHNKALLKDGNILVDHGEADEVQRLRNLKKNKSKIRRKTFSAKPKGKTLDSNSHAGYRMSHADLKNLAIKTKTGRPSNRKYIRIKNSSGLSSNLSKVQIRGVKKQRNPKNLKATKKPKNIDELDNLGSSNYQSLKKNKL
ncbi:unnamed protein product [Moneuplotes crassus]|uniref:Tyrosine-protein phosphatase domain-containing protein n=1 Tax=Euplotes crassus TaxID=5936 RepID=A0AAD1Y763_EUPCR|nr:unnamed protein product [Moneuplotes crassus]